MVERILRFGRKVKAGVSSALRVGLSLILLSLIASCSSDNGSDQTQAPPPLTPANARVELTKMMNTQQQARKTLDSVVAATGWDSPEATEASRHEEVSDSINMARLDTYVTTNGWPGRTTVGVEATSAAFLVVQHADLEVQLRYLPILREEAEKDEIMPAWLAMLEDRVLRRQDKPQLYGSQLWEDPSTGELGLYPVQDSANIDARRAAVGLGPLDDYLRSFGLSADSVK